MTKEELLEKLDKQTWLVDDRGDTLFVVHRHYKTKHEVDCNKIKNYDWLKIKYALIAGHDVDQITRVCGYFSKVKSWNNGKQAELLDRHRDTEDGAFNETNPR